MEKLQIIHMNDQPYGIRDEKGYLFFFTVLVPFGWSNEEFKKAVEEKHQIADYLLGCLKRY